MNLGLNSALKSQFDRVDNSPIVIFRMAFGLLIFAESAGAIVTGWVRETFVEPAYTFTVIGLEWLQPLPGNGMYYYFGFMALLGIMVMLGFYYRASMCLFTLLWTMTYVMQKTNYNNHYYMLILVCVFMWAIPAHGYASLDVKRNRALVSLTCPRWCISIFQIQMWIIFTYAAVAKIYPGWWEGEFIELMFLGKRNYPLIGRLLQQDWLQAIVVFGGIAFDLLIIYFLLWKRTRAVAFAIAIFFHLFNSAVFQIGIFPYLMIAMCVFFFEPDSIRKRFLKKKPVTTVVPYAVSDLPPKRKLVIYLFGFYFLTQILLPLRHHRFEGNVFWTEEGHRLSWRMMLRTKSGSVDFLVKDPVGDSTWTVRPIQEITRSQVFAMAGKPDMIWQFSQKLKEKYQSMGIQDVQIFANSRVRLNQGKHHPIIDPEVDLANVKWERLKHSDWILSPE